VIARLPRVGLIACAIGLVTAALGFAATSTLNAPATPAAAPVVEADPLVVPDVRKQAYVFAKGTLEQAGFAWRVEGSVPGYAANTVASQSPAPGTRVEPDGAPIVVLGLARNSAYPQEGVPENASPYAGKPARPFGAAAPAKAAPKPAATPKPAAKPKAAAKPDATPRPKAAATRKPAFAVPGAPAEPADEISLPARAKQLAAWLERHPNRTPENVSHWLYQHSWIVTGAQFGWHGGAEALRTLVAVDERVQELWGVGASSEAVATRALSEVRRRSK
jgi:hypothetical protein